MKTAMQELMETIKEKQSKFQSRTDDVGANISLAFLHCQQLIEKQIEKEKQQIIEAYDKAANKICLSCSDFHVGENYYNETYNK